MLAKEQNGTVVNYIYLGNHRIASLENRKGKDLVKYFHNDALGTPVVVSFMPSDLSEKSPTNDLEPGKLAKNVCYLDPWGNVERVDRYEWYGERILFTGKELDLEGTRLYYFNARYYDAGMGGFLGKDLGTAQYDRHLGLNTYAFCWNNPVRYTDPDGNFAPLVYAGVIGTGALVNLGFDYYSQYKASGYS